MYLKFCDHARGKYSLTNLYINSFGFQDTDKLANLGFPRVITKLISNYIFTTSVDKKYTDFSIVKLVRA